MDGLDEWTKTLRSPLSTERAELVEVECAKLNAAFLP